MKRIPIDECPAGPEIDAAVAKARGWKRISDNVWEDEDGFVWTWEETSYPSFRPSIDITAAWGLVEELYQRTEEWISIARDAKGNYWAGVIGAVSDYDWWEYSSKADTAPLAITRAYLKAKGIKFVEVEE